MDAGPITGVPLDIELAAPHGIARRITDAAADNDPPGVHGVTHSILGVSTHLNAGSV